MFCEESIMLVKRETEIYAFPEEEKDKVFAVLSSLQVVILQDLSVYRPTRHLSIREL
jgi:hypothetical protein